MDNKVCVSVNSSTVKSTVKAADIAVICPICEESTIMNSNDCRAYGVHGVFICDKCKAAIKRIRDYLESVDSTT